MRRLRPPPSEEIQVQEELLMTDNIAMNKTDEAFANENEVLDMNAAVKIKRAKLANKTDTEKIEGIWQNSVNDEASDATVAKEETRPSAPSWHVAFGSACYGPEYLDCLSMYLDTATARCSTTCQCMPSTKCCERCSASVRCRTWHRTQ
mmetsp:Transcript_8341/g.20672  ORF Transcript_8341/g.20672 Transcript_8341/m.20672 type:complete len:149 (-) Transcript_8341:464-910(-)